MTTTVSHTARRRTVPATHRWTREQYFQLSALGYFEGGRVELIDGKIVDTPAQKNLHVIAVEKAR